MNYEQEYSQCGALCSPKDDRDYTLDQIIMRAVFLPEEYIVPIPAIIMDQKQISSCVPCTIAQIKHSQEFEELGDTEMFSAAYIYANRKDTDYQGSGMYPREALQNLVENGICHQKDFQGYDEYEYADLKAQYLSQKDRLDRIAKPYRIASYYRLNDLEDIKIALTTVGYVQICFPVYKCLYTPDKDGVIKYNKLTRGKNYGGHSMTCVGYSDKRQALAIVNSWGKDYGTSIEGVADGGCIWIPYDYEFTEAWSVVDATTQKELLKSNGI